MRISDWSYAVCASDLISLRSGFIGLPPGIRSALALTTQRGAGILDIGIAKAFHAELVNIAMDDALVRLRAERPQMHGLPFVGGGRRQVGSQLREFFLVEIEGLVDKIGRGSCRERVCQYV